MTSSQIVAAREKEIADEMSRVMDRMVARVVAGGSLAEIAEEIRAEHQLPGMIVDAIAHNVGLVDGPYVIEPSRSEDPE